MVEHRRVACPEGVADHQVAYLEVLAVVDLVGPWVEAAVDQVLVLGSLALAACLVRRLREVHYRAKMWLVQDG